ncbi:hypothetical protein NQ318_018665 [Aromia moschata]|uniref:Mediator of RNA polymerase II transcription subunit 16 n=1 Tax=Aromia moschata TaxID=1265417 RepID=A0AAV8ZIN3_9CUCU|nr:hypothetical protein NQ318_018665 [Aromia moschata]
MDHIFTISKKPSKTITVYKQNIFNKLEKSILCSISSTNVVAFSTESNIEETNSLFWSSNVYVADLNSPWQVHKVLCNSSPVTVLQWDFTGELLLIADENGCVRIYHTKDYILNDWALVLQTMLQGEHICLNSEKKDSSSYIEKFQHVKFACSVKQFGGRPASGALLLTTTGMLAAILLPQYTSQTPMLMATESLGPTRIYVKTADICYGKNGHFLLAVSSGDPLMPVQCYKVSVKKIEEKCVITSQSLLSFFLFEAPKEALMDQLAKEKNCTVSHIKWIMREDADSLVVTASSEKNELSSGVGAQGKSIACPQIVGTSQTSEIKVMELKGKRILKFMCEECQSGLMQVPKLLQAIDELKSEIQAMKLNSSPTLSTHEEEIFTEITDYSSINNDLQNMNWIAHDTDERWRKFITNISNTIERRIPITTVGSNDHPWINTSIKHEINKKRNLWHLYQRTKLHEDYQKYRQCSNNVTMKIRNAKTQYENGLIDSGSSKRFFKYVKKSLDSRVSKLVLRDSNNTPIQDPLIVANMFADYFSASFTSEPLDNLPELPDNTRNTNSIEHIAITEDLCQ